MTRGQPWFSLSPLNTPRFAFSDVERVPQTGAPNVGEDTDAILAEIGYGPGEVARLHDDGIVAGPR